MLVQPLSMLCMCDLFHRNVSAINIHQTYRPIVDHHNNLLHKQIRLGQTMHANDSVTESSTDPPANRVGGVASGQRPVEGVLNGHVCRVNCEDWWADRLL